MSYPPGQYPGQPYDPNAQNAREGEQQAPGHQRSDPTMLNPMGQQGYPPPPDPTQLNPLSQPDPAYQPVPPSDPTVFNPLSQPDPAYQQGQPYDPYAQQPVSQYPSVPQYQQQPMYQQPPQQYPPQQGGFPPVPPGPPGQGYPPQYGPGGSGSGGGGGKVLAAIGSVLLTVLVIAGIIGLKVWKNNAKHHRDDAGATTTTSLAVSTSAAGVPTTPRSTAKVPPITTAPTTSPRPATVWIAAAYNEATNEVHWARSSLGQDAAVGQAQSACGSSCQEPIWSKDACVAFAFGRNNGWGSAWGLTIPDAQNKAQARAQNDFDVQGPFEFWSKCATE